MVIGGVPSNDEFMTDTGTDDSLPTRRRVPQQFRSRSRVERILREADRLVVEGGVESVNTRSIAKAAGIPVASLYQYFADKDEILVALVARDSAEMDDRITQDLAELTWISVAIMVETVIRAMADTYRRRPTFVMLRVRGRSNIAVRDYCREHNRRMSARLFRVAQELDMVVPDSTGLRAELAVEVSDRLFQIAFEKSLGGDPLIIDEAIAMVTSYLELQATRSGIAGAEI